MRLRVFPKLRIDRGENAFRDSNIGNDNFTAELATRHQYVGWFLAEKCDGEISLDGCAARTASQSIQAGRHIN